MEGSKGAIRSLMALVKADSGELIKLLRALGDLGVLTLLLQEMVGIVALKLLSLALFVMVCFNLS